MHNSENTADPTHALPNGLSVSQEGPVTLLRLSRPAKRNALDRDMIAGIEAFFRSPPDGTRAVVLHGEGSNFSAGLDLSDVAEIGVAESISHSRAWHRAFEQIEYGHVPVVVVMHGAVIGGGLELALGVTATIERHQEQPGDVPQTWASLEKARRMLGYDPRTNYADGVKRLEPGEHPHGVGAFAFGLRVLLHGDVGTKRDLPAAFARRALCRTCIRHTHAHVRTFAADQPAAMPALIGSSIVADAQNPPHSRDPTTLCRITFGVDLVS